MYIRMILNYIFNILRSRTMRVIYMTIIILTSNLFILEKNFSHNIQDNISQHIMRFRVLANSNSKADQDLKLKVRDGVLKLIKSELTNAFNKDDTKNIILKNLKQITSRAQEVVKQNGFEYKVKSYICNDKFPTKVYCDLKFPSGYYDALKIIIGSGKGKNFCCGMFPPLCFIDLAKKTSPDNIKQCLKNVLPDEGYKFVTNNSDHIKFKFKFKVAEILDNYKNRYAKKNHKPKEIIL